MNVLGWSWTIDGSQVKWQKPEKVIVEKSRLLDRNIAGKTFRACFKGQIAMNTDPSLQSTLNTNPFHDEEHGSVYPPAWTRSNWQT